MPKESIKDKVDGRELDLSLSDLSVVPVKEMASLPKVSHIDMSCNLLTTLPPEFCNLTHIVKIDLSKNKLTELPANFGNLSRLQHLDLLGNQIRTLPVSMAKLSSLKWMDIKDNPLDENLQKIVGDCLDEAQCRQCAKNVVHFMKMVEEDQDRERQKKLKREKDKEAKRKANEEREKERQKAKRKAERQQRRQNYEAAQAMKQREEHQEKEPPKEKGLTATNGVKSSELKKTKKTGGIGCCGRLLCLLVAVVAVIVGLYFYCESNPTKTECIDAKIHVSNHYTYAKRTAEDLSEKALLMLEELTKKATS